MDIAIKFNKRQCLCALISSAIVAICVCIGVTMNLTTIYDQDFDNMGIRTFCMFTVNSNILAGIGMILVFPFALEGLRKNNYHLPDWVVTFLHAVCPILTIVAFTFFVSDHKIRLKESLWSLVPVIIYAAIYFIMVVVIGPENGGWEDFYGFATKMPLWISMVALLPITYGISTLLRIKHNHLYNSRKRKEAALYIKEFKDTDIRETIANAGRSRAATQKIKDIVVPTRVIEIVVAGSDVTVEEGCRIYLDAYLGGKKYE